MKKQNNLNELENRTHTYFTSTISHETDGTTYLLGEELSKFASLNSLAYITGSLWLGKKLKSRKTENLIDLTLRLLADHGPYVSGSVNTIVASRAGKDLVSSLASGLLTIGPRFGGAISGAAEVWYKGVEEGIKPASMVEDFAKRKVYIPGIGHRKYRVDSPDPRVKLIMNNVKSLKKTPHLDYAREVESITLGKNPSLILNVDGALAASLLDCLLEEEKLNPSELQKLISIDFFNAFFVLSRSIGFIAHYLDQRRLDEGLFRLSESDVHTL